MVNEHEEFTFATPEPTADKAQRPGFGAKLWYLFAEPQKTFRSLSGGHEWIILWILVSVISVAAYLPVKSYVKRDQIAAVEEQLKKNPDIPAEQRQAIVDGMAARFDNPAYLLLVPVSQAIVLMIVSGLLLFIANIILGGNASFLTLLNAFAWTMMLVIPATIVTVPLIMAKGSTDISLGLGALASADTGAFAKTLLEKFELFGLWQVWLSSVAVSVIAGVRVGKSFAAVFAAWLVWVIIQGGLATLGIKFGM